MWILWMVIQTKLIDSKRNLSFKLKSKDLLCPSSESALPIWISKALHLIKANTTNNEKTDILKCWNYKLEYVNKSGEWKKQNTEPETVKKKEYRLSANFKVKVKFTFSRFWLKEGFLRLRSSQTRFTPQNLVCCLSFNMWRTGCWTLNVFVNLMLPTIKTFFMEAMNVYLTDSQWLEDDVERPGLFILKSFTKASLITSPCFGSWGHSESTVGEHQAPHCAWCSDCVWVDMETVRLCRESCSVWEQRDVDLKNVTLTGFSANNYAFAFEFCSLSNFILSKLVSQKVSHLLLCMICSPSPLSGFSAIKHDSISVIKCTGVRPVTHCDLVFREGV